MISRRLRARGSILLGVVILVAILVLMAGAFGVLMVREQNQRQQIETQKRLETAFKAMFPYQEDQKRAKANMWTDFGFTPDPPGTAPGGYELGCMTSPDQVEGVQASKGSLTAYNGVPNPSNGGKLGAWNGPYWQGSVDGQNRPVDGWGRPILLRRISSTTPPGWQVFSPGVNGVSETGDVGTPVNDDQVYPQPPYEPPTSTPTSSPISLTVTIVNESSKTLPAVYVSIQDSVGAHINTEGPLAVPKGTSRNYTFLTSAVPSNPIQSGAITISIVRSNGVVLKTENWTLLSSPATQTIVYHYPSWVSF